MNSLGSASVENDDLDDDVSEEEEEEDAKSAAEISDELEKRFHLVDENIFKHFHPQISLDISNSFRTGLEKQKIRKANTFCYSEVHPYAFLKLLVSLEDYNVEFGEDAHFIDIGSGTGKTLVVVSLLNKFKRVVGIELVPGLHKRAQDVVKRFNTNYRTPIDQSDIELLNVDALNIDWSFASLVYIQATMFDEDMMKQICVKANSLASGAVLIVINNRYVLS
jgi:hypothetical protein